MRENLENKRMNNTTEKLLIVVFLLCFFVPNESLCGQENSRTLEEVSGQSLRDMNGLHYMNRNFVNQPDGKPVPQSEDDQWIPNMSLDTKNAAKTGTVPSGNTVPNRNIPAAVPAQAAVPSMGQGSSAGTPLASNTPEKVALQSNYSPGFQVGSSAPSPKSVYVPPTPPQNEPRYLSTPELNRLPEAPKPQTVSAAPSTERIVVPASGFAKPVQKENEDWDDAAFAFSGNKPAERSRNSGSVPAQSPAPVPNHASVQSVIPAPVVQAKAGTSAVSAAPNTVSVAPKKEWESPFSKAGDQKGKEVLLSGKKMSETDLSDRIIEDIRVSGLEIPTTKFNKIIKTKIGNKFNQQTLEEDKRALLQTKQFIDVVVSTSVNPEHTDKVIVNFDLTSRRLMQYIKVVGNQKISKSTILEELGMKRGETRLDPYDVENGRIRIIELYKNKGYTEPYVEILRGDRPEDIGVVYLINDGLKQKVLKTIFEGNTIASNSRLKSLVGTKPGFLYLIGGDFTRERLDEDITKLLEYYRKLGFFDAQVDREFEEGEGYTGLGKENAWVTVKYIINEGPRYKIRKVLIDGNNKLDEKAIREKIKMKNGDFYNQMSVEEDRIAIKNRYHDIGYVLADIEPSQIFTDQDGFLDIRFKIAEKDRYRVRDILVDYQGEEARTKSTVILNMLDFAPGQLINGPDIRRSESTLRRSGYFNDKISDGILPTIKIIPDTDPPMKIQAKDLHKKKKEVKEPESGKFDGKPEEESAEKKDPSVIRGQVRQLPSSFGTSTASGSYNPGFSTAPAVSNPSPVPAASAGNSGTQPAASVSPYSDTSMYNNYNTASMNPSGTQQGTVVPAQSVYGSNTTAGTVQPQLAGSVNNPAGTPQLASTQAPGFTGAGVDAVFPGSVQQQRLSNQLLGNGLDGDDGTIHNADVIAQVKEGRTGMFQASIGVNSDYGLIGNISLTERNFDMFKWPTDIFRMDGWKDSFRGAGQIFQLQASPGTEIQRYSASWDVPHVLDSNFSFGSTVMYGDRNYTDWFESRYGGELRLGRQWTPRFSTSLDGSIYNVKLSDPMVNFVPDLNEALGNHMMYTAGLSASYDTRNHPFLPSDGYVVKGSAEQVLGDFKYPRVSLDARTYFTMHKRWDGTGKWILGLRSAAGWTGDKTPIYDRYFGGGSMNLRGFEYREVTPRYLNSSFGVGGNFEFYNSAELLVPVSGGDEFMLAFFLDTGTVSPKISNWDTYRVAPGFGFRIAIPMLGPAPLALDFAFPVNKGKGDVEQVFSFSITGSR
ncbi:MAG: BamA/TamA family outer membrane protein [Planctomycetia bacterium]|nr:BamA/TamA family outer membrane protein [Planctomycetia bacterium]